MSILLAWLVVVFVIALMFRGANAERDEND
jgi:hypothetical protein